MKKKSDETVSSLLIDGETITSAKEISNYFNTFFKRCRKNKHKYCQVRKTHLSYLGPENNEVELFPSHYLLVTSH